MKPLHELAREKSLKHLLLKESQHHWVPASCSQVPGTHQQPDPNSSARARLMLAQARLGPSILLGSKTHSKPWHIHGTWYSSSPAQAPSRQTPPAGREQRPAGKHELPILAPCSRAEWLQGTASPGNTQECPQKEGESHSISAHPPAHQSTAVLQCPQKRKKFALCKLQKFLRIISVLTTCAGEPDFTAKTTSIPVFHLEFSKGHHSP